MGGQQWNPAVRQRFQALLRHLRREIRRSRVRDQPARDRRRHRPGARTRPDSTAIATSRPSVENIAFARKVFTQTHVVQYVNFWPCEWNDDRHYMSRFFEFAAQNASASVGRTSCPIGPGQMKNSYPFFNRYKESCALVAMAVQEPTLTYTNPATKKHSRATSSSHFAGDYLGVNVIFWSPTTPWLRRTRSPRSPDERAPGQRTPRR